jgi:hypothetical protein
LQEIVLCGGCGHPISTMYPGGKAIYDCSRSRCDHVMSAQCRSILAEVVDRAVGARFLEVLAPAEIALALAAADEVTARKANRNRSLELRVERTRYEAARAERAFHHCDPNNRLVARSLERRWEEKLRELAEAQRELACQMNEPALPSRDQLESLAADFPRLVGGTYDFGQRAQTTAAHSGRRRNFDLGTRWRQAANRHSLALRRVRGVADATTPISLASATNAAGCDRTCQTARPRAN